MLILVAVGSVSLDTPTRVRAPLVGRTPEGPVIVGPDIASPPPVAESGPPPIAEPAQLKPADDGGNGASAGGGDGGGGDGGGGDGGTVGGGRKWPCDRGPTRWHLGRGGNNDRDRDRDNDNDDDRDGKGHGDRPARRGGNRYHHHG
jgi:hypothetical protein